MITDIEFPQFHRLSCSVQVNYFKIHITDNLTKSLKENGQDILFLVRLCVKPTFYMKKRRPLSLQRSATKRSDFVASCFVRGTWALPDIKKPRGDTNAK